MLDLAFVDYTSFLAPEDNPLLTKWQGVKDHLDGVPSSANPADLASFNFAVNTMITYRAEPPGSDVWQTPLQTFSMKSGDCEDFAILKYGLLKSAGMNEDYLRLVVGEIKSIAGNQPHAWLAVYGDDCWLAMDQKFDKLIHVEDYINWLPIAAFHADQGLLFEPSFSISQVLEEK